MLSSLDNADSRIQGVTCVPAGYWQCALYEVMWGSFIHHLHAFLYLPIYLFFALVWHGRTYIKITSPKTQSIYPFGLISLLQTPSSSVQSLRH